MDFSKLLKTIDLPEINDDSFLDKEQRTYHYFLENFNLNGFMIPFMIGEKFNQVLFLRKNPDYINKVKKSLEEYFEKNPNKNKTKFEKVEIVGEEFIEKIPLMFFIPESSPVNVISKRTIKKYSIRDLIYEIFPLYLDDPVNFSISFHGNEVHSGFGPLSKCFVPTEKIEKLVVSDKLELLSLSITLESIGESRKKHEDLSNIFDTKKELEKLLNVDLQKKMLNNLSPDLLKERSSFFNIDKSLDIKNEIAQISICDFGAKEIIQLRSIYSHFETPYSNEKLLCLYKDYDIQLEKMKQWINRSDKDGKNGYYK